MKKLIEIENAKDFLSKVYESEKLTNKFHDFIINAEKECIEDTLYYLGNSADYSITIYGTNQLKVKNNFDFLDAVETISDNFGVNDSVQRAINDAKEKRHTESFNSAVDTLARAFLNYFNYRCTVVEQAAFDVANKEITQFAENYVDWFIDEGDIDDVFINDDGKVVTLQPF